MPKPKPGSNARAVRTARRSGAIQPPSKVPVHAATTVEARRATQSYEVQRFVTIPRARARLRYPAIRRQLTWDQTPLPPLDKRDPNNTAGELDYTLVYWTASDEAAFPPQTGLARLPMDALVIAMQNADQATQDQAALVERKLLAAVTQARMTPEMYHFVWSLAFPTSAVPPHFTVKTKPAGSAHPPTAGSAAIPLVAPDVYLVPSLLVDCNSVDGSPAARKL